jgi:hypothetical protein
MPTIALTHAAVAAPESRPSPAGCDTCCKPYWCYYVAFVWAARNTSAFPRCRYGTDTRNGIEVRVAVSNEAYAAKRLKYRASWRMAQCVSGYSDSSSKPLNVCLPFQLVRCNDQIACTPSFWPHEPCTTRCRARCVPAADTCGTRAAPALPLGLHGPGRSAACTSKQKRLC